MIKGKKQKTSTISQSSKSLLLCLLLLVSYINLAAQCRELVWQDEFDGTTIDLNKWSFQTGASGWGNNELQYYTDRSDNATISNGKLQIIAKEESYMGANYTSARMRTINKGDWRYGRFEASIKLPGTQGIWPAFWMMPTGSVYGGWPKSGEMDIMEHLGSIPQTVYGTVHTEAFNHAIGTQVGSQTNNATLESEFHVYALEWSPTQVDVFLDDTKYFTFMNTGNGSAEWPFDQAFHFILNIAVGGNWPGSPDQTTVFPQIMEVEYVRVYQELEDLIITGADNVQPFATNTSYSLPSIDGSTYTWTVPAGAIITAGQGTPTISVDWGNIEGTVTGNIQTDCGTYDQTMSVTLSDNLWQNPSFEADYVNWTTNYYSGAVAAFDISTTEAQQGAKAACVNVSALGPDFYNVQLQRKNLTFKNGITYNVSFWAKADSPGKQVSFAYIHPSTFNLYGGQTLTLTDTWQEYTYSITASFDTPVLFNLDLGHAIGTFCFDNFQFLETASCDATDVIISDPTLSTSLHQADNTLETNGSVVIAANSAVSFTAGTHILLKAGFHAPLNSIFEAKIEDCQSVISSIQAPVAPIVELANKILPPALTVFPNPSSGNPTVQIHLTEAGLTEVVIYDLYGQEHAILFPKNQLVAGTHAFNLERSLVAGTYFLVLKTEGASVSEKMIVLK